MTFELVPVQKDEKQILANLLEKYNYEFSQYDLRDVNKLGLYGYDYLDSYWTKPSHFAFFIEVDGNLAGFAMVSDKLVAASLKSDYSLAVFFVVHKYRRHGIGKNAAFKLFDMFSGIWDVCLYPRNTPSVHFWNKVVPVYTHGNYKLYESCEGADVGDGTLGDVFHFSTDREST
ncbi:MAG: GNAT family N-acetyltransferase [Oscillospiraceae bacterium]|jgi:predicted acetyltransferase|nr:GNAT family N-acetyltransferase [Oscillospiraceae bacterium]